MCGGYPMDNRNRKGFGFLKRFSIGQINAGVVSQLTALEDDVTNNLGYVNVIYAVNDDAVSYDFFLDNDRNRALSVPALNNGVSGILSLSGTKFSKLQIKNLSGATNGVADTLKVVVMKEYGDLEKREGY